MRYENIEDNESIEEFAKRIETLEEAKENAWNNYEHQEGNLYSTAFKSGFDLGVKWIKEKSYSEEDMIQFGFWCRYGFLNTEYGFEKLDKHLEQWKQFKK